MNLFKKVLIIGLATMALGTAAMGAPVDPNCNGLADATQKPIVVAPASAPATVINTDAAGAVESVPVTPAPATPH